MGYAAVTIVAILVGFLTAVYLSKRAAEAAQEVYEPMDEAHERAHEADEAEAKTADPVDYLRTGLERLR